jgi:hypothetical protein
MGTTSCDARMDDKRERQDEESYGDEETRRRVGGQAVMSDDAK